MDLSSQEDEGKKKMSEVKTFPVAFDLGKIKENLTINTNTSSKPSKEQIINQAIQFHLQGNVSEAVKYYQLFINQGYKDHKVFSNYGVILRDLGKLKDAELCHRKAIDIKPDFAEARSNLGITLRDLGKLKDAELCHRKAIDIKPDFAEAHYNLGITLTDLGKLQDAEISYLKAIELNPNFAEAHLNLGIILTDVGKLEEAFDSYLQIIKINPTYPNIYSFITEFLRDFDTSKLSKSKVKTILNLLLERNDISHKELINSFNYVYNNEIISKLEKLDSECSQIELIINNKVIINALKKITFQDIRFEKLLTNLRKYLCIKIAKNKKEINYYELQFIITLGKQCFLNEYIFSLTEEENISLNNIIKRCQNNELNEINISILSCYFSLYKLLDRIPSLKSFNSSNQSFKELINIQISEPLEEIDLSKNIKKLGRINDYISRKVKSQYEKNPYPRWRYGNNLESQKISITQAINNEIKPSSINFKSENSQLKVLIAGCGTGQQILHAKIYNHATITGIDLSLSSLSYAQRKIKELEINNVKLIQMDILEVNLLEEKFDIILCSGVLHHMDEPSKGLKALLGVLKTNGFLKLGLYSELARQNIIKARNYIASKKLQTNEDHIRNFRETIFSGKTPEINSLTKSSDFYTLSSCRDLCFHAQEHRFNIKQLQEILKSNELKFLGFLLQKQIKSIYEQYFPEDKKQTNLQNWAKFEEKHPNTFEGMYQFWVCKS
ncbi:Translation elongation factor P [Prochlorococcus sp. MIT 0801]|nr:tetratricopeptide repeat protein [Prochlorococcus sp. MIT 0801]AIQ96133.1 Translation elongation factor P [Prochlorococcus sp. MIT 0801]